MVLLRDLIELDNGKQLVLVVLKNLGAEFVAVAVSHALTVDANFHVSLLYRPGWANLRYLALQLFNDRIPKIEGMIKGWTVDRVNWLAKFIKLTGLIVSGRREIRSEFG